MVSTKRTVETEEDRYGGFGTRDFGGQGRI